MDVEDLLGRLSVEDRERLHDAAAAILADGLGVDERGRPGGGSVLNALVVAAGRDLASMQAVEDDVLALIRLGELGAGGFRFEGDPGVTIFLDDNGDEIGSMDHAAPPDVDE